MCICGIVVGDMLKYVMNDVIFIEIPFDYYIYRPLFSDTKFNLHMFVVIAVVLILVLCE